MAFNGTGSNVTSLNANNITSGTVPTARLGSGTANSSTFLRGDQTYASVAGAPNPLHGKQVFTSSGTFTVPTGVTTVLVTVIAAGGNGGNGPGSGVCGGGNGGGGGAGGYIVDYVTVTPGGTASVSVGTNSGTRTSSFAGGTTITASGGSNGANGVSEQPSRSGASGSSTIFGVTYYSAGARRQSKDFPNLYSSNSLVSTSSNQDTSIGQVYAHGFGAGGVGPDNSNAAYNGVGYGAGGGGGGSTPSYNYVNTGGTGTNGLVIVEW